MSEQRPVAIVTGAASNIGLACAQRFAATHTVIMADIAEATQQAASLPYAVAAVTADMPQGLRGLEALPDAMLLKYRSAARDFLFKADIAK